MEGSSADGSLSFQLGHVNLSPFPGFSSSADSPLRFEKILEAEGVEDVPVADVEEEGEDRDRILSQDFFCTPDYITPDAQQIDNGFQFDKSGSTQENIPCPKSPEKTTNSRNKRHKKFSPNKPLYVNVPSHQAVENRLNDYDSDINMNNKSVQIGQQKKRSYVSQSAIVLRSRVTPPPCIRNPYMKETSSKVLDIFGDRRFKSTVSIGGDGLSRYHTDFHEIEQIGYGNFSNVFKVLKRIDGCLYAVKQSNKQLHHDMERRSALMEVQALAVLGSHENVVGYYTSWFENERLYIQMELCDRSLSISPGQNIKREEAFKIIYQMAKALHFMHEKGIAHLDVKPENIYFKEGIYKLGDFGCATLIDKSLCVEEGDSRYMPPEMLNDKYEHLDKVDIFSLGASVYELVKGSPLPDSGPQFSNLREGKIPLLPGYTIQFQTLLKAMMDPDPLKRPSAKEILEHPTFEKPKVSLKHSSSRQSCSRLTKLR
ncbi:wee1-like protein kinase isoform X2 [Zingiber officinale]|uniref:wee1-like protein kinase isoform X2 n=1 Tax=Zingiber officinale TaxID=94328 RepID=UPI001C4D5050|nr:wee1-like protein kinase isoform X2 [Zingiber officinale]